jgi:hypothetical protein
VITSKISGLSPEQVQMVSSAAHFYSDKYKDTSDPWVTFESQLYKSIDKGDRIMKSKDALKSKDGFVILAKGSLKTNYLY